METKEYYESLFRRWLTCDSALKEALHCRAHSSIDLWSQIKRLSTVESSISEWKTFSLLAVRYQHAAVSEAAVERLFSGECEALGRHMTHINHDTMTARLILRGKHAIDPVAEAEIVSWAKA